MIYGKSLLVRYFAFFETGDTTWSIMNSCNPSEDAGIQGSCQVMEMDLKGAFVGRSYSTKSPIWKDCDTAFAFKEFQTDDDRKKQIWRIFIRDVAFLKKMNLMDYSWVPQLRIGGTSEDKPFEHFTNEPYQLSGEMTFRCHDKEETIPATLHIGGLIDFLQSYDNKKKWERGLYTKFVRIITFGLLYKKKDEKCATNPTRYADRFLLFVGKLFGATVDADAQNGKAKRFRLAIDHLAEDSVDIHFIETKAYKKSLKDKKDDWVKTNQYFEKYEAIVQKVQKNKSAAIHGKIQELTSP